VHLSS